MVEENKRLSEKMTGLAEEVERILVLFASKIQFAGGEEEGRGGRERSGGDEAGQDLGALHRE